MVQPRIFVKKKALEFSFKERSDWWKHLNCTYIHFPIEPIFLTRFMSNGIENNLWAISWAVSSSSYVWFYIIWVSWNSRLREEIIIDFYPVSCSTTFPLLFPLAMVPQMLPLSSIALSIYRIHKQVLVQVLLKAIKASILWSSFSSYHIQTLLHLTYLT